MVLCHQKYQRNNLDKKIGLKTLNKKVYSIDFDQKLASASGQNNIFCNNLIGSCIIYSLLVFNVKYNQNELFGHIFLHFRSFSWIEKFKF